MTEAVGYIKDAKGCAVELPGFIKKFTKTSAKDGKEMRKKIEALELIKLNERDISKIIDIIPEDAEELNKIFVGIGLDEEETKKILDLVKEFK